MASGRALIQELVRSGRADMANLSRLAGRNSAYIHQFLTRGVPVELPEKVREALAPHIGVTPDALRERDKAHAPSLVTTAAPFTSNVRPAPEAPPLPAFASFPRNVPIQGQAQGGEDGVFEIHTATAHDWMDLAPRPPGIANNKAVFAVYVDGDSMSPWKESGRLIYIDPRRPVRIGDYVMVVFKAAVEDGPRRAMVKRLQAKRGGKIDLLQFNPAKTLTFDAAEVGSLWRVLETEELLGFG